MDTKQMMVRMPTAVGAAMLALLLAAGVGTPRLQAAEATSADLRKCVDGEWAEYNECLMESGSEWGRKVCDVYFSAGLALCSTKYYGELIKATTQGF